eukprot:3903519-Rhodomonas_salina.1
MSEIAPLLAKIETLVWKGVFCQSSKWKELANALADSTPLKELNLGENRMDARAALNFSAVFKHLTQLETLKIASCAIGAEAIKNLGPEIGLCTSLSSLDIAKNRIGNEGAREMGSLIRKFSAYCCPRSELELHSSAEQVAEGPGMYGRRVQWRGIGGWGRCQKGWYGEWDSGLEEGEIE